MDDPNYRAFDREIETLSGMQNKTPLNWTEHEAREGLLKFCQGELTDRQVSARYGPSKGWFANKLKGRVDRSKDATSKVPQGGIAQMILTKGYTKEEACAKIKLDHTPGPGRIVWDYEAIFIESVHNGTGQGADPKDDDTRRKMYANALRKEADKFRTKGDFKTADRLANFIASKSWYYKSKHILVKLHPDANLQVQTVRAGAVSINRAAANEISYTVQMFQRIAAWMSDLAEKDPSILLRGPNGELQWPSPDQLWNADEIGIDADGKWKRVSKWSWAKTNSVKKLRSKEKAAFWVSLLLISRADGQCPVNPVIVHEGPSIKDTNQIRADHSIMGVQTNCENHPDGAGATPVMLPPDYLALQSPSGYMDEECFLQAMHHFTSSAPGPKDAEGRFIKAQFLFLDGHYSHLNPAALDHLADRNVHVFFLRSGNSENDQPNDCGINKRFKSCFVKVREQGYVEGWLLINVPIEKWQVNGLIVRAWDLFKLGNCTEVVSNAWDYTGLKTWNPSAWQKQRVGHDGGVEKGATHTITDEGKSEKASTGVTGGTALSSLFSGIADMALMMDPDNPDPEAGLIKREDHDGIVRLVPEKDVSPCVCLRAFALEFFMKPHAKAMSEYYEHSKLVSSLRKVYLPVGASMKEPPAKGDTRMPSTRLGLGVTREVIAYIKGVLKNKEEAKKEKFQAAQKRKIAAEEERDEALQKWRKLKEEYADGLPENARAPEGFTADDLKKVAKHLRDSTKEDHKNMKNAIKFINTQLQKVKDGISAGVRPVDPRILEAADGAHPEGLEGEWDLSNGG